MASSTRRVGTAPVVEEIVPSSGWTDDHSGHFLLVDLPEFRKEEVTLQVDASTGRIIVKGERQTNEQKRVHFELTFPVPPDSDVKNISGTFDSEILHVYVPKRPSQEHRESDEIERASNGNNVERPQEIIESEEQHNVVNEGIRDHGHQHDELDRERGESERRNENAQYMDDFSQKLLTSKSEKKHDMSRALVEVLMRNKGVVTTAVVAFFFGLYVSQKFHSWNNAP